ncbi:MAG: DUF4386 domain-containing protein [Betaproteobacteria bacterium]|nr:MAG: DUF4386 domain-containing protein [Betaproteobacteria bacterium]
MEAARRASRIIGALILAQMAGSWLVNFVLTAPLFGAPGFLVSAAAHSEQIAVSVLLGLGVGGTALAIAIVAFPIFGQHSQALALWFVALAVVSLSVAAVENMSVMSMLSLSEAYAKASAAQRDQFEVLRVVVASARNWAHYIGLIFGGSTLLVLYALLYLFALVPRALAAFGLVAIVLQLTAVAMPLFGHSVVFLMLAPLGVSQLILALWLFAKGFRRQAL